MGDQLLEANFNYTRSSGPSWTTLQNSPSNTSKQPKPNYLDQIAIHLLCKNVEVFVQNSSIYLLMLS